MSKALIDKDEYDKIIELYNSGLSQAKIGEIYGVCNYIIGNILRKNNITMRDDSHKGRIYTLNEDYFDEINTTNKAYILGLLYADGCNYPPQHRVKLELQERDKNILDKINIEIGSNKPLTLIRLHDKNPNWQNTYRLDVVNKHISEQLIQLGVVQNKSLIITFPRWLNKDLYRDFIRGYFDGDGCVSKYFLTIASTKEFCMSLSQICIEYLNIEPKIQNLSQNPQSNTKLFYISGMKKMKIFLDWIYRDSELYIQRKYESYQNVI